MKKIYLLVIATVLTTPSLFGATFTIAATAQNSNESEFIPLQDILHDDPYFGLYQPLDDQNLTGKELSFPPM